MIKCNKCGSTDVTVERRPNGNCICHNCDFVWGNGTQKELSTADKLLWLIENRNYPLFFPTSNGKFVPRLIKEGKRLTSDIAYDTLEEAINATYDWVKEGK